MSEGEETTAGRQPMGDTEVPGGVPEAVENGRARKPIQLLTFLGTNDYKPATYTLDGAPHPHRRPEQYVQAALLELLQQQSSPDDPGSEVDRLTICLTDAARDKHWKATADNSGGLEQRIARHVEVHHLPRTIVPLEGFPTGQDEGELWVMFERLSAAISPDHDLIVDVTHGFRLFPIVLIIALAFLRQVKDITIRHIYYGAWEARDKKTQIAPIFDVTPMLELLDWSAAMQQLVQTGDARALTGLIGDPLKSVLPEVRDYAQAVAKLADALNAGAMDETVKRAGAAETTFTAIGPGSTASRHAPIHLALEPIHERYRTLVAKPSPPAPQLQANLNAQIAAAELLFEHDQLQTGFTILSEVLTSIVAHLLNVPNSERQSVGGRFEELKRYGVDGEFVDRLLKIRAQTTRLRNAYSHAWTKALFASTTEHQEKGRELVDTVRDLVRDLPGIPSRPAGRRMLVVMNHPLLHAQEIEARTKLGVDWIVYPDARTQGLLGRIPPDIRLYECEITNRTEPDRMAIKLGAHRQIKKIRKKLEYLVYPGDCALIHGEPGLVTYLVSNLTRKGVTCYHATTQRMVHEVIDEDGKVTKTSTFEHVMFREYRL